MFIKDLVELSKKELIEPTPKFLKTSDAHDVIMTEKSKFPNNNFHVQ